MGELVKVVRRAVYDDLVRKKMSSSDEYQEYFENLEVYQKDVVTTLPRIELNKSKAGLIHKGTDCTFKAILSQLSGESKDQTPGVVNYYSNGVISRQIPATAKEIKVLKALAVAQISYSQDYANAVGYIFMCLFKDITKCIKVHEWQPDVNFNKMQEVVFNSITACIDNFLNEEVSA